MAGQHAAAWNAGMRDMPLHPQLDQIVAWGPREVIQVRHDASAGNFETVKSARSWLTVRTGEGTSI
jgi:hypothetical protein